MGTRIPLTGHPCTRSALPFRLCGGACERGGASGRGEIDSVQVAVAVKLHDQVNDHVNARFAPGEGRRRAKPDRGQMWCASLDAWAPHHPQVERLARGALASRGGRDQPVHALRM